MPETTLTAAELTSLIAALNVMGVTSFERIAGVAGLPAGDVARHYRKHAAAIALRRQQRLVAKLPCKVRCPQCGALVSVSPCLGCEIENKVAILNKAKK